MKIQNKSLRYIQFFEILSSKRKVQFVFLFFLTFFSSALEVVSVGSIIPLITVILDPKKLEQIEYIRLLMQTFQLTQAEDLVLPILALFAFFAFVSGIFRIILLWFQTQISFSIGTELGSKVFELSLKQEYMVHISRSSHEVVNAIRNAKSLNSLLFSPIFRITNSVITLISIFIFLFYVEPDLTIILFLIFSTVYLLFAVVSRKSLRYNGKIVADSQIITSKILFEGLNAYRDLILNALQNFYITIFRRIDKQLNWANSRITFIGKVPWFIVEASGIILIAILAAYERSKGNQLSTILPYFGALALGAQKMLPVLQLIFTDWTMLKTGESRLDEILKYLKQEIIEDHLDSTFTFNDKIVLKDVSFSYNKQNAFQIANLNLEIKKGERVGFIGVTGEGKSTLLDIIMGLLTPRSGKILIDSLELTKNNRMGWFKLISSVPQSIFLTEGSIRENIALGIPIKEIDEERLIHSADGAQLLNYIDSLPMKFETQIGERGVKLSGGQKQRIGIARALYKNAKIMVLDEATSSLDNETEVAVMDFLTSISHEITVLIIAHRLTTLKLCDKIVEISKGEIARIGSYEDIIGEGRKNEGS